LHLEITRLVKGERIYKDFLSEWFALTLKKLLKVKNVKSIEKLKAMELSVVFVDKKKIKKLNKKYRGFNKATDVLSFDGDGFVSAGELVFCMEVIAGKAKSLKLPAKVYLGMLMIHGILHLLGYEHEHGGVEEAEMFSLQDQIMRKVASKLAPDHKKDFDVSLAV